MGEKNKNKQKTMLLGVGVFAVGVAAILFGYAVPSPISTTQYQGDTYIFPFMNWLTIAGLAIVGYTLLKKRKKNED